MVSLYLSEATKGFFHVTPCRGVVVGLLTELSETDNFNHGHGLSEHFVRTGNIDVVAKVFVEELRHNGVAIHVARGVEKKRPQHEYQTRNVSLRGDH
jgi:hypothetical protein